jgi:pimeloyl-ACP methyl ester carboxylesterase
MHAESSSPRWRAVARKAGAVALGVSAAALLTGGSASAATPRATCQEVSVPVTLQGAGAQTVAGTLCEPALNAAKGVQLLLPGGSYNRAYWQFPYKPETYSYARAANAAGYATFAIDRLGTGASTHPPGTTLTPAAEADVAHHIVGALRSGAVGGTRFSRVVEVGHSYGSVISWFEAGTYHDVDAVVITGMAHVVDPALPDVIGDAFYPASEDPKFAGTITDPDYLTTRPGIRSTIFYAGDAEQAAIAVDEQTKDTLATPQLTGSIDATQNPVSRAIDAPVLLVDGSEDLLICGEQGSDCSSPGALVSEETPWYASAPRLDAYILPGAGHSINMAPNAPIWFGAANAWIGQALLHR